MAPDGLFLPTIPVNPTQGTVYSGDEVRIDIIPDYFLELARPAGLRLLEHLGTLSGQEAYLFTAS
jgi:hypothetical protein